MKAPEFDVTRLPLNPWNPDYMSAVVAEEKRVCGAIDARLDALVDEFVLLVQETKALALSLDTTPGILARWGIRRRLKACGRRLSDNLALRNELVTARWRRTYGA